MAVKASFAMLVLDVRMINSAPGNVVPCFKGDVKDPAKAGFCLQPAPAMPNPRGMDLQGRERRGGSVAPASEAGQ